MTKNSLLSYQNVLSCGKQKGTFSALLLTNWLSFSKEKAKMTPDEFRALRKSARMTQAEMAERLDVSRKTIVNYENGIHPIPVDVMSRLEVVSVAKTPAKAKALNGPPYYRERPGMPAKYKMWQRQLDHPLWHFDANSPVRTHVETTMKAQGHGKPAIQAVTDRIATLSDLDGYAVPTADQAYAMMVKFGCDPLNAYDYLVFIGYESDLTVANPNPQRRANQLENAWVREHGALPASMAEFYRLRPEIKPTRPTEEAGNLEETNPELAKSLNSAFGL